MARRLFSTFLAMASFHASGKSFSSTAMCCKEEGGRERGDDRYYKVYPTINLLNITSLAGTSSAVVRVWCREFGRRACGRDGGVQEREPRRGTRRGACRPSSVLGFPSLASPLRSPPPHRLTQSMHALFGAARRERGQVQKGTVPILGPDPSVTPPAVPTPTTLSRARPSSRPLPPKRPRKGWA